MFCSSSARPRGGRLDIDYWASACWRAERVDSQHEKDVKVNLAWFDICDTRHMAASQYVEARDRKYSTPFGVLSLGTITEYRPPPRYHLERGPIDKNQKYATLSGT